MKCCGVCTTVVNSRSSDGHHRRRRRCKVCGRRFSTLERARETAEARAGIARVLYWWKAPVTDGAARAARSSRARMLL